MIELLRVQKIFFFKCGEIPKRCAPSIVFSLGSPWPLLSSSPEVSDFFPGEGR
jgi:hypothetical protein